MKALIQRRVGWVGDKLGADHAAADHDRAHAGRRDRLGGAR